MLLHFDTVYQNLAKSVDVHWSYSVQRQCRFFETQCIAYNDYSKPSFWICRTFSIGTMRVLSVQREINGASPSTSQGLQYRMSSYCTAWRCITYHNKNQATKSQLTEADMTRWRPARAGLRPNWAWCCSPFLSLIHIWRCRRSYACRSRWSPYH